MESFPKHAGLCGSSLAASLVAGQWNHLTSTQGCAEVAWLPLWWLLAALLHSALGICQSADGHTRV